MIVNDVRVTEDNMVYPEDGSLPYCKDCGYLNRCRCSWCGRCGQLTGNTNQGHYWKHCKVTGSLREFHFCCPDCCELEGIEPTKPFHPRYVALLEQRKAEEDAVLAEMEAARQKAWEFLDGIDEHYKAKFPDMIASIKKNYSLE